MIPKCDMDAAIKYFQRWFDLEIAKALKADSFFTTRQQRGNNFTTEQYVSRAGHRPKAKDIP